MPDITRTQDGQIVLSQQFAERLYADMQGAGFTAETEFLTAYDQLTEPETHDADLADDHRTCDGSCAEPNCRNGMPLLRP